MSTPTIGITDVQSAVSWLRDTAGGRALVTEATQAEAQKRRERRSTLLAQQDANMERELSLIRAHESKRKAAVSEIERARAAITEAEARLARIEGAHRQDVAPFSRQRDLIEAELYDTRPVEALDAFCAEMTVELERTYKASDAVKERCIDGVWRVQWSNRDSLAQRADAITSAIRDARAATAVAVDDADLAPRLNALRGSLPAIDERPSKYRYWTDDAA